MYIIIEKKCFLLVVIYWPLSEAGQTPERSHSNWLHQDRLHIDCLWYEILEIWDKSHFAYSERKAFKIEINVWHLSNLPWPSPLWWWRIINIYTGCPKKEALSWFFGNNSNLERARNKSRGYFEKFRKFSIR